MAGFLLRVSLGTGTSSVKFAGNIFYGGVKAGVFYRSIKVGFGDLGPGETKVSVCDS